MVLYVSDGEYLYDFHYSEDKFTLLGLCHENHERRMESKFPLLKDTAISPLKMKNSVAYKN
jgi:hypothetical protein